MCTLSDESDGVPAEVWAEQYGFTLKTIISHINAGILDGYCHEGEWFVVPMGAESAEQDKHTEEEPSREPAVDSDADSCDKSLQLLEWVSQVRWLLIIYWLLLALAGTLKLMTFANNASWLVALGVVGIASWYGVLVYEGWTTGVVRASLLSKMSRVENPKLFAFRMVIHAMKSALFLAASIAAMTIL